jgi:hypothetical protein
VGAENSSGALSWGFALAVIGVIRALRGSACGPFLPLERVIQREVADPIARALLQGEYADGDTIRVDASPDGLVFAKGEPARVG